LAQQREVRIRWIGDKPHGVFLARSGEQPFRLNPAAGYYAYPLSDPINSSFPVIVEYSTIPGSPMRISRGLVDRMQLTITVIPGSTNISFSITRPPAETWCNQRARQRVAAIAQTEADALDTVVLASYLLRLQGPHGCRTDVQAVRALAKLRLTELTGRAKYIRTIAM
jgi:hypothetical protein